MAAFDDSTDPALGAACNRLAAWVESLPAGVLIDDQSGLTEQDFALILRHLHETRQDSASERKASKDCLAHQRKRLIPLLRGTERH